MSNANNKQGFLDLLADKLDATPKFTAKICPADADLPIVEAAIDAAQSHDQVVVTSEDTDVLVL